MYKYFISSAIMVLCFSFVGQAQQDYSEFALNRGNGILYHFSYGYNLPGADMKRRFGNYFGVGSGLGVITDKGNWQLGLDFNYFFGNQVAENPLSNLLNDQGFLIGNDREYADIQLRMRGFYVGAFLGKLIGVGLPNPRSGIRLTVSGGLFQHKIRIQDDPVRFVPQISDEYEKGYDRLTYGLGITQFIGYQLLSSNKRLNFFAGVEFTQAFTSGRRGFNFDTRTSDAGSRLDLNTGFRAGWILPFYVGRRASEEIYY